jgi:hypothetical protein
MSWNAEDQIRELRELASYFEESLTHTRENFDHTEHNSLAEYLETYGYGRKYRFIFDGRTPGYHTGFNHIENGIYFNQGTGRYTLFGLGFYQLPNAGRVYPIEFFVESHRSTRYYDHIPVLFFKLFVCFSCNQDLEYDVLRQGNGLALLDRIETAYDLPELGLELSEMFVDPNLNNNVAQRGRRLNSAFSQQTHL